MGIFDFLKRPERQPDRPNEEPVEIHPFKFVPLPRDEREDISAEEYYADEKWVPKRRSEISGITQEIWTHAPDGFETMYCSVLPRPTMETDYDLLKRGINLVFRQKRFNESRPALLKVVEESHAAYASGDREKGMELISKVQIMMGKMK